jgi:hypothetical protein
MGLSKNGLHVVLEPLAVISVFAETNKRRGTEISREIVGEPLLQPADVRPSLL